MKWKSAMFALLVGVGMTMSSCSNNDDIPGPGIDPDDDTELKAGEGFFSLNLSTATKLLTKADYDPNGPYPNRETGDPEESVVSSALMVFYNPATLLVEEQYTLSFNNGNGTASFTGTDVATYADPLKISASSVVTKARKLEKKDYKLLIVLNPTAEMTTNTAKGKSYGDFENVKTPAGGASYFNTGNGNPIYTKIPMTNLAGLVNVAESQFKEKIEDAEKALDMPVVKVDRMVAKVTFAKLPDPAAGTIGDGSTTIKYPKADDKFIGEWALDITNKKSFWIRHTSLTAPGTGDGTGTGTPTAYGYANWLHEATYNTLLRDYIYAEDPNFSGLSQKSLDPTTPNAAQIAEFNYEDNAAFTGKTIGTTATREYALENTMAAEEQWEDVTTRILIRGNYVPKGIAEGESYFYYGGYAIAVLDLARMFDDLNVGNINYPWPTTPSGLKDAAIKAHSEGFFRDDNAPNQPWTAPELSASKVSADGSLTFYKNGVSFYRILVRHFSDALSMNAQPPAAPNYEMNFGRYGIVRNNVYNVELQSVKGPGSPVIPKPGGPDDGPDAYISAQIQVLPWVVREQPAEI